MAFKRVLIALAVTVHVVVAGSILSEPLDARAAGERRFLGWQLYHDSARMGGPGSDFFAVYHAGVNARDGISIYRRNELHGGTTPYFYEYRYLPVLAGTLGRAVVLLPPARAYQAWLVLTDTLLWLLLALVFRRLLVTVPGLVAWLAMAVATPFFLELYMGQFTFVATALGVLGVWLAARARASRRQIAMLAGSGVLVLSSIILKIFPALTLVAWVRRRPLRWLLAAVVVAVALLTIPGFLSDPRSYYDFRDANAIATPDPGNFGVMHAVFLAAERLGVVWTESSWALTVSVTALLLIGVTSLVVLFARRRSLCVETALLLLVQLVVSFQVWEHHTTAALLAGGFMMMGMLGLEPDGGDAGSGRHATVAQAWVLAVFMVWLALPTPYALFDPNPKFWSFSERMLVQCSKALPVLGVYLVGLTWILRDGVTRPWRPPVTRDEPA